jgi:hypothetical protein
LFYFYRHFKKCITLSLNMEALFVVSAWNGSWKKWN